MPLTILRSVGLGAVNNADDVRAVKGRLIELGFDWLVADGDMGPLTIQTIRLFQGIKNGFNRVGDPRNDGRVDVGGDTLRWLQASNAPRWQKMPAGSREEGFTNSELADTSDNHDFGTNWLAQTLRDTGATYRTEFLASHSSAALLTLNDASRPRGGDTPMHATHETGMACDIRLPRRDGGAGGITVESSSYDRAATRALLKAFLRQPMASRILLSDQVLVGEGLCRAAQGHLNHAHFEVGPPPRGAAED
ncbi:MAG: peptidoglycan-binding domain-containing protein [Pyrinomonadaceae bacterium]